jgi:hypothetical protein
MKTKWLAAVLVAIVAGIVAIKLMNQPPAKQVTPVKPAQTTPVASVAESPPAPPAPPSETIAPPVEPLKKAPVQSPAKPQNQAQTQSPKQPKEPLHDPDARAALALVGIDGAAEQYWLDAIYDSSLPDNEREDLMEDLNEVGFADPKKLTADDLPLIVSRLQLIEEIAPYTDPFMAEHLGEAYKDLANMYSRVTGQ